MALYQSSVLKKHLKQQDKDAVAKAYKKFSKHFHNPKIQENIRNSKEEQYQEGFLRELFVDVFGYTLNPQPKFNLTTELKNEKGAKKADGAILKDGNALGVIELKGTDTKDLEKVRQQAFDYKANQTGCVYVITSNFEKLRFYINNAVEWEEFDLFTISEKEFEVLYLCLASENLLNNVPLKIKEASIVEEESITKKFYADYSLFKRELYRDLVKENMRNEVFRNVLAAEESVTRADKNIKLTLFKKSQKLIDRFLFIFFAEDRGLLPPNSTLQILEEYDKLKEMDAHVPLYNRFKLYFSYLDQGRKGTTDKAEIFAYNGGLFKPDNTLDSLLIDDELLYKHTKTLAKYDFESQVDVNILGHIFENSLNEIESVNAEIEGVDFDKQKTKRKKDGVFYTPKYITKYIVDNTVGKLCTEKKAELGIVDEEYTVNRQKDTKRKLLDKLEQYRNWLLEITICDPACGSGAFLNQALDFLINEHRAIDELQASLLGGGIVFPDIENTILEKNIYGVDLNEESVEIAKLSLWLRTAQPRRKLNDLNNNIKCGNSLIDSKSVAGDKAFKWEDEFPEVFAKAGTEPSRSGGFDVIIGNPPYGAELDENQKKYVKEIFSASTTGKIDSYRIFLEHSTKICKESGIVSFIVPNTFLYNVQSYELRKYLLSKTTIEDAVELRKNIFEDAPDVVTVIFSFVNDFSNSYFFRARVAFHNFKYSDIDSSPWEIDQNIKIETLLKDNDLKLNLRADVRFESIKEKLSKLAILGDHFQLRQGTKPYGSKTNKGIELISKIQYDSSWEPAINGRNIARYRIDFENDYVKRSTDLHSVIETEVVEGEKIYFQRMRKISLFPRIVATYDNTGIHGLYTCSVIWKKPKGKYNLKFLLSILNSKLINVWYKNFDTDIEIKLTSVKQVPIPLATDQQQILVVEKVDLMLRNQSKLENTRKGLLDYLSSQFENLSFTKRLQNWFENSFSIFIKELNKAIKMNGGSPLSKMDEMEWMEVFETKKKEALELKAEIDKTDMEIDQMVYELYGLSEEEIKIVEGA